MNRPAVFLDRDGTLINERGYLADPAKIHFYPSTVPALRKLQKAGFLLVVVTNQSGVGRGYFSLKDLARVHQRFLKMLFQKGIRIEGIYFCPHRPDVGCRCRKPQPTLARLASRRLRIDLSRSFVVGDQLRDLQMAKNLKIPGVLVLTGGGMSVRHQAKGLASKITRNIATAADWVLSLL